ncbi:MAG: hypothetical protein ACK5M4_11445 [Pseudorhodobacter sp.]
MILNELTQVPEAALPVAALKTHLRMGSGFTDDGMQDGLMVSYLRAALTAIEGRIGKAVLSRRYRMVLDSWRDARVQSLPLAPVSAIHSINLFDADGMTGTVDPARYRLMSDPHRPKLVANGASLPAVPPAGRVEIEFEAGFGADWAEIPADLAQAVMLLSAEYYEMRHDGGMRVGAGLPSVILTLLERWRTVRVLGGGAA